MKFNFKVILIICLTLVGYSSAQAGVIIGGTRVIYDGAVKEASLSVNNPDNVPYLIQSWIEAADSNEAKAPFIITPPLFRLDHGQQNVMRIVRAGNIPENKESMYWLNIKSIPSAEKKQNSLQIAIKTRIKLIYRPLALKGSQPEMFVDKLNWQKTGNQIQVTNPTNFYMNFNEITVAGKKVKDPTYVAPGSSARFELPAGVNSGQVLFKIISDFGGVSEAYSAGI